MIPLAENAYPAVPPVFTAHLRAMHSDRITPVYVVGYLRIFVILHKYFAFVTNILRLTASICTWHKYKRTGDPDAPPRIMLTDSAPRRNAFPHT